MIIPTWNEDTACRGPLEQPADTKLPRVRFAADVTTHSVLSRDEYSESEFKACYYNKTDYKKFKKSSLITLKLNREGELPAGHSMRGLECRTREGAAAKKAARQQAVEAFREAAQFDSLSLAVALHKVTAKQQHAASVRGMCDELEAREYQPLATIVRKQQSSAPTCGPLQLQGILEAPQLTTVAGPAA